MANEHRPIAAPNEKLEQKFEQPKSLGVPLWRRWLAGFEVLLGALACFYFIDWAIDALNAAEGASGLLRFGVWLVTLLFVSVCMPLLAYGWSCWVVIRPWNREYIFQSLQSAQGEPHEKEQPA